MFANSADWKGKKVLGGAGLCKWWKGVYEDVVSSWASSSPGPGPAGSTGLKLKLKKQNMKLGFILPGYDEQEAKTLLGAGRPLPEGVDWTYTPPFTSPLIPSPSGSGSGSGSGFGTKVSLATLIPSLPDDPKTRFLQELVSEQPRPPISSTTAENKQVGKEVSKDGSESGPGPGSGSGSGSGSERGEREGRKEGKTRKSHEAEEDAAQRKFAENVLHSVGIAEFWERMGFRQECASGDVTGFFTLESVTVVESKRESEKSSPDTTTPTAPAATISIAKNALLSQAITERLLTALTNLDFASPSLAVEGSTIWLEQTRSIVVGEVGEVGWEVCVGRIEAKAGQVGHVGQSGQAEQADTGVGAGVRKREEVVTMLQPRKKKKVVQ